MSVHRFAVHVREAHGGWATHKNAGPRGASLTAFPCHARGVLWWGAGWAWTHPRTTTSRAHPPQGSAKPRTSSRRVTETRLSFYWFSAGAPAPAYSRCPCPGRCPINSKGFLGFGCLFYSSLSPAP